MSHRRDRWYTITQRVLSTGGVKRVYIVTCNKCGRQGEQHASQLTDDARRKWFQREGWELGKWKNLHVCPQCAGNAPPPVVEVEEPEPNLPEPSTPKSWTDDLPKLQAAWTLSYEDEHLAFIEWLRTTYGNRYIPATPAAAPPTLMESWHAASTAERSELWHLFQGWAAEANKRLMVVDLPAKTTSREEIDEFLRRMKEGASTPPIDDSWQHGPHIDSMPVEAPLPPINNPPTVEPVEEPVTDDNEGAEDWYVELMQKQQQKKRPKRK
jgi:hypothetical protein